MPLIFVTNHFFDFQVYWLMQYFRKVFEWYGFWIWCFWMSSFIFVIIVCWMLNCKFKIGSTVYAVLYFDIKRYWKNHSINSVSIPIKYSVQFSRSVMSDSVTPWIAARQASLSITNSQSLPKLMSIKLVMPSSHLILCHPLLLLPPIPPSIRVFSNESTLCMR